MQTETEETNQRFAAQLPRNLAANIAYFLVNIVIGVLLVPYFINTLGVAVYGFIPLATSITGYFPVWDEHCPELLKRTEFIKRRYRNLKNDSLIMFHHFH